MLIDSQTHKLPQGCYFDQKQKKDLILLHYTAGSTTEGAINFWKGNKNGVSTPYIISPNGTIYETYNPEFWSYHLGVKGTWAHDKRSVAIEMVNFGPLRLKGNTLYAWPANYTQKFCDISETDKYIKSPYRGFDYYAKFPEVQLSALKLLIGNIKDRFGISGDLPPVERRGEFNLDFSGKWKGIIDHASFRPDKFDIGPAFNWDILK